MNWDSKLCFCDQFRHAGAQHVASVMFVNKLHRDSHCRLHLPHPQRPTQLVPQAVGRQSGMVLLPSILCVSWE